MNDLPDFSAHGYQTIRQLGFNAAGGRVVYLAADLKTQKQVAIKQFQFAKGAGWSEFKAIAGKDGDDAKLYLEKQIKQRLKKLEDLL